MSCARRATLRSSDPRTLRGWCKRPWAFLTTPARLALGFLLLYVVGTCLIFLLLDFQLRAALIGQVDKALAEQQTLLALQYKEAGMDGVTRAIRRELQSRGHSDRGYQLRDANGTLVLEAGGLALPTLPPGTDAQTLPLRSLDDAAGKARPARVLSFVIGEKIQVHVAHSLDAADELTRSFRSAFLLTLLLIVLLGLAGGAWLAWRFWSQIEAFNQMAMKIVNSGNLASRITVTGNDEFSALAMNMNAVLDKVEKLVQGIRQVSDNIAHDLRTPLTRLRADVEVALQQGDPGKYRETLERALVELQRMQEIFQSLLSLGQAEAGTLKIRKKPLDLTQLLEDIAELYAPLAEEKGQTFIATVPSGLEMSGDKQLLAQALSNLVDNAVKYVPAGGRIELVAARQDGRLEIRLDDDGPGIPPEMRQKVFDRFVRVDPSRTLPGTGLGLSLVKAFIEMHQGSITLTQSRLGGAGFVILLPVQ